MATRSSERGRGVGGRWRRLRWSVAVAGLVVVLGGCWPQPGFDAGRTNWNTTETELTAANVDQLEMLWRTEMARLSDDADNPGISVGGSVYTTTESEVVAIDARTGAVRWRQQIVDPQRVGELVYADDSLYVSYVTALPWFAPYEGAGGVARLDPSTGEILSRTEGSAVYDLAVQDGQVATQTTHIKDDDDEPVTGFLEIDWAYDPLVVCDWHAGECPYPHAFAFVGERIVWSQGTSVVGFSPACPPGPLPGNDRCGPDWSTDVGAPLGRFWAEVAAVGGDEVVHNLPDGFVVLDAVTGQELWRAHLDLSTPYPRLAVADGMIVAANRSGETLWAFPADGCGAATCAPLWSGSVAIGDVPGVTVAGDVVYLSTGSVATMPGTIWAFPLHGCGVSTCEPLTTRRVDRGIVAPLLVDDGRVIAISDNLLQGDPGGEGRPDISFVTAFALPGT